MGKISVRTSVKPISSKSVRFKTTVSNGNKTTTRTKTVHIK